MSHIRPEPKSAQAPNRRLSQGQSCLRRGSAHRCRDHADGCVRPAAYVTIDLTGSELERRRDDRTLPAHQRPALEAGAEPLSSHRCHDSSEPPGVSFYGPRRRAGSRSSWPIAPDTTTGHCPRARRSPKETPEQTAVREVLEETGLSLSHHRLPRTDPLSGQRGHQRSGLVRDATPARQPGLQPELRGRPDPMAPPEAGGCPPRLRA